MCGVSPGRGEETPKQGRVGLRYRDARPVPDPFSGTGKAGSPLAVAQVRGDAGGQLKGGGHEFQVAGADDVAENGQQQPVRLLSLARQQVGRRERVLDDGCAPPLTCLLVEHERLPQHLDRTFDIGGVDLHYAEV